MSVHLSGRAAAPGAALAPAFTVHPPLSAGHTVPEGRSQPAPAETARLTAALEQAEQQLTVLAARVADVAGEDEAEIFEAHAEFAADPELVATAARAIDGGASAERAAIDAFDTFRALLAASSSEYLAARAADLDDVRDRVLAILLGHDTAVDVPDVASVVVAHELSPSQTASIPRELIAGIVTETGSPTSHAAILARSLGIPAVVACEGVLAAAPDGTVVAIDGRTGAVLADPTEAEAAAIEERMRAEDKRRAELTALRDVPGRTADGHRVELAANIGSTDDLAAAREAGAEGSGLVRTEFLFQGRRTAPTVEEQVGFYTQVLRGLPGHRVVFRTMDVGADKPLPFVERDPEENPALGLRGIRLSLQRPALLRDQLRALLRAGLAVRDGDAGRLAIMFPLVAVVGELLAARAVLDEVAAEEGITTDGIEVGVMVEVPSAALAVRQIAPHVDFVSVGTNDLLQYLFAADRLNGAVADLADVCEPVVLRLIGEVAEAAHAAGAWVGVCGEAASDPVVAAALVGLGVDELSMTRVAIPEVKDALATRRLADCRAAVQAAVDGADDAAGARRLLEEALA